MQKEVSIFETKKVKGETCKYAARCPHCVFTHKSSADCQYVKLFKSLSGLDAPFLGEQNSFILRYWRSLGIQMGQNSDRIKARQRMTTLIKTKMQAISVSEEEKEEFRNNYQEKIGHFYEALIPMILREGKSIAKELDIVIEQGKKRKDYSSGEEYEYSSEGESGDFSKEERRITRGASRRDPNLNKLVCLEFPKRKKNKITKDTIQSSTSTSEIKTKTKELETGDLFERISPKANSNSNVETIQEVPVVNCTTVANTTMVHNANTTYFTPNRSYTRRDCEQLFLSNSTPTTDQLHGKESSQFIDRRVIVYASFQDETVLISIPILNTNFCTIISKIQSKFPNFPQHYSIHYWDDFIFKNVRFDSDALDHIINTQTFPIIKISIMPTEC